MSQTPPNWIPEIRTEDRHWAEMVKDSMNQSDDQENDIELQAQGVMDVFQFLDREVVDKVVDFIKSIDVKQTKEMISLLMSMIQIDPDGSVYLNLKIKLREGKKS